MSATRQNKNKGPNSSSPAFGRWSFVPGGTYAMAALFASVVWLFSGAVERNYSMTTRVILTLVVAYLPSYTDGTEYTARGRYWPAFARHWLWKYIFSGGFFPKTTLITEEALDPTQRYILASHPHGTTSAHHLCYGTDAVGFYAHSPGETRRDLSASIVFKIPFFRDLMLWIGMLDAARSVAHRVLRAGMSVGILVGGVNEQLLCRSGEQTLFLKKRKGYAKLAVQYELPVVSAFCFGETEVMPPITFMQRARLWLFAKFRLPIPLFRGARWGILPSKRPMTIVVGKPIIPNECKTQAEIDAEVDRVHQAHLEQVQRLYRENVEKYGNKNDKLVIH